MWGKTRKQIQAHGENLLEQLGAAGAWGQAGVPWEAEQELPHSWDS